jgi:hypothetical protein
MQVLPRDEGRQLSGQRLPKGICVPPAHVLKQLPAEIRGIGMGRSIFTFETHIVRMYVHQGHAAVPRDPIELLKPDIWVAFLQEQEEESRVVGEGARSSTQPARGRAEG